MWLLLLSLSCVRLFASPRTVARPTPLSFTIAWNWLKFMSVESVMLSNHQWLMAVILDNAVVGKLIWHKGFFFGGSWLRAYPVNHHLPHWELDNDPVSIEMAKALVPVCSWAPSIPNPGPLWTGSFFTTSSHLIGSRITLSNMRSLDMCTSWALEMQIVSIEISCKY